jgi:hypothetical protein
LFFVDFFELNRTTVFVNKLSPLSHALGEYFVYALAVCNKLHDAVAVKCGAVMPLP